MGADLEPRGGRVRSQTVQVVFVGGPADGEAGTLPDGRLDWMVPVRESQPYLWEASLDPATYRPMRVARYEQVFVDGLAVVDEAGRNVFQHRYTS